MLTTLQKAIGAPLRSEQRIHDLLPRQFSRGDLFVVFIAIVLFVPNASVAQSTHANNTIYLYWLLGGAVFLLPATLASWQLQRFLPANGTIYLWTHHALGSLWSFFAGFCAWASGCLMIFGASNAILSLTQGLLTQRYGLQAQFLSAPWQEGCFLLATLALSAGLSLLPLRYILRCARVLVLLYILAILTLGGAAVLWLLNGHAPQISPTPQSFLLFHGKDIVLFSIIARSLLGIEVPLNLGSEMKHTQASSTFMRWGPATVLAAYLIYTFGITTILPADLARYPDSVLNALYRTMGTSVSTLVGLIFIGFFLLTVVFYNATSARFLLASALDHRLPHSLSKINKAGVPYRPILIQIGISVVATLIFYGIEPPFYPHGGLLMAYKVYEIVLAAATVTWNIAMIFLFLDLIVLLHRLRSLFGNSLSSLKLLLAPRWLLHTCCVVGIFVSVIGICGTVSLSWDRQLIPMEIWVSAVLGIVLTVFLVGLVAGAYPRLLSNLHEQTAVAQENARLYEELRKAYDELNSLNQMKDAFLATASHELRTPLTIVQGYLELLIEMDERQCTPQMRYAFLQKARRACDELVLLQANIMDASSNRYLDAARLYITHVRLQSLCTTMLDLFEPIIEQQARTVHLELQEDVTVLADETRLKQILWNLLSNALRYSPADTPLRLVARADHDLGLVRIQVIDLGLGIPPDKQEIIFHRFVRLDRDTQSSVRGSGLGLAICRQLVEAMNGRLSVTSSGVPGEGSTFAFTLPLAEI